MDGPWVGSDRVQEAGNISGLCRVGSQCFSQQAAERLTWTWLPTDEAENDKNLRQEWIVAMPLGWRSVERKALLGTTSLHRPTVLPAYYIASQNLLGALWSHVVARYIGGGAVVQCPSYFAVQAWVSRSLTSHSTLYRPFRDDFYRSDDPTNNVKALKKASWPLR